MLKFTEIQSFDERLITSISTPAIWFSVLISINHGLIRYHESS